MMERFTASGADKEALKALWAASFHYHQSFIDWYFEKCFVPEETFIFKTEEKRAAACGTLAPLSLQLNGKTVRAAYLSGMALLPEYRTEENQRQQLTEALTVAGVTGYPVSLVIPSDYKFYERYGFRTAYFYKEYRLKPEELPSYRIRGTIVRMKNLSGAAERLGGVYREFTAGKNGYALRSPGQWELILEDLEQNFGGQCVLLDNEAGETIGYLLMIIRDRRLGVYEFAYKNREAYEGLIGFLHAHRQTVEEIILKAPADDLSHLDFCDSRSAVTLAPFAMARINRVSEVLSAYAEEFPETLRLQVIDRLIPENNKTFQKGENGIEETGEEATVTTDIGTLSQLYFGLISVSDAVRMNLIAGDAEPLSSLFSKKENYLNMLLV